MLQEICGRPERATMDDLWIRFHPQILIKEISADLPEITYKHPGIQPSKIFSRLGPRQDQQTNKQTNKQTNAYSGDDELFAANHFESRAQNSSTRRSCSTPAISSVNEGRFAGVDMGKSLAKKAATLHVIHWVVSQASEPVLVGKFCEFLFADRTFWG